MEEHDTFPFGTETWRFVDEAKARSPATREGVVEVGDKQERRLLIEQLSKLELLRGSEAVLGEQVLIVVADP